jgi:hypothetical protein
MLKHSFIALTALGITVGCFNATQASAFTAAPQLVVESNNNPLLIDVRHRGGGNYGGNYRHYNGYHNYGHRNYGYRRYCNSWHNGCGYHHNNNNYYGYPWVLGGIGLGFGLGYGVGYYGGGYGNGYYDNGYYGGGYTGGGYGAYSRRHIAWCLNRYRSYNPSSNTWVAYSGRVHQCYSPYLR